MSRPVCGAADRDRTGTVFPPRDFKSLASACFATAACHDTKLVYHGVAEYVKVPFFHRGCGRDTWRRLRKAGARWKAKRQTDLMEKGRPDIFCLHWMQEEAKLVSVFEPGRIFACCRPIL